jgi:hypothetical protein
MSLRGCFSRPTSGRRIVGRAHRRKGLGIVSVHATLPELGSSPHRTGDIGRRIRFVVFTAILVVVICLFAAQITPGGSGHHLHRPRSSGHVQPRA